jgi:HAD superfamily hydrolase (TIGR01509 family)|tara:strand:+ start:3399 stop:4769 length:1371 start_codon:yes stop_codon:yes gene_type:complete
MIKHIIFDLDGVLISSKDIHYESLNRALGKDFKIPYDEHLAIFDGLPTRRKLEILTERKGLETKNHSRIAKEKQKHTVDILKETIKPSAKFINLFEDLKSRGFKITCASNAVRSTVEQSLLQLGIIDFFDYLVSNEDVKNPKPHFEMYFKCMLEVSCSPGDTLVIEDSHIGRQAVLDAGCNLLAVDNPDSVDLNLINKRLRELDYNRDNLVPWINKTMNVLIPMAGAGSRFQEAGYTFPKPLVEVGTKPMIQVVIENLNIDANYTFIVQKEHYDEYNLSTVLNLIKPGCNIIQTEGLTEGAACTTLLAKEIIDSDEPLLLANSDQFVEWNSNEILYSFSSQEIGGGILTFKSTHPKWSFAKVNDEGWVTEVAEKQPISDNATVGIYYWSKGSDYVSCAEKMIEKDIRHNNEFYVCPVFNQFIEGGGKVKIQEIEKMWGLGTPEDLTHFLTSYKDIY